jgi:hypothetical protein
MKTKGNHTVKLKEDALDNLVKENYPDCDNTTIGFVLSDITGMNYSQIYRIRTGRSKVGVNFIASVLAKNPQKRFDDLFYVQ